jgi:hypothetical protein
LPRPVSRRYFPHRNRCRFAGQRGPRKRKSVSVQFSRLTVKFCSKMWAVLVLSGSAPRVKDRLGSPVIIVQVRRTKRSMSSGAENRSRCPLLNLSVPLRPRRDAPSLLLSGFSIELEARIWFAAQQRRDLCEMKTRPCAPGKINAPPSVNLPKHLAGGKMSS